jgi:PKD repeat protein
VIKNAANLGWPYCTGPNTPYNDFDFATMTSGSTFDCANPTNNSPNNTGLTNLPPAEGAEVWYTDAASAEFPELGTGCRCPMAGPMYHYDAASTSDRKFPQYHDDTPFFYEWGRNYVKEFRLDANRDLIKINSFTPTFSFIRPMDMEFGPDGAMYVLEWGTGFGGGNADSGLYRIDYIKSDRAPIARASATPSSGPLPLAVAFSSSGSMDPDGDALTFAWDFQSNGSVDSTERNPSFTYTKAGNYTAKLTVRDSTGKTAVANVPITAGNTAPTVTIQGPVEGGFFDFGDRIGYEVEVSDPQDGTIDCSRVVAQPALGHDTHAHPLDELQACEGAFETLSDAGHGGTVNVFYVLEARYTDLGAKGAQPLVGRDLITLQPKRKQAEFYSSQSGITAQNTGDTAGGGQNVTSVNNGDRISFTPMNLKNIDSVTYRWAGTIPGSRIEVHVDSPTGPLISDSGLITPTTGAQTYQDVTVPITDPGGTHELFFVFFNQSNLANLFNLNWIDFNGAGVSLPDQGCLLDSGQLTVIAPDGGSVSIGRSGSNLQVSGADNPDPSCGGSTVDNVDTIKVYGGGGNEQVTLDLANGPLGPGATAESSGTSEIEVALALGGGDDAVSVQGGNANDKFTVGVGGLNLNGDSDADVRLASVEDLTLGGGGGTDTLSAAGGQGTGGAYAKPVTLTGGSSHDVLTGGLAADMAQGGDGNDTFKALSVADGADTFDGGTGSDAVTYGARVTAVRVSLDGVANDGDSNGAEGDDIRVDVEKVTGGRGNDSIDDGGQVVKNTFQGGPGADTLNAADGVAKNDTVDGGTGTDSCTVDAGDTVISCP